MADSDGADRNPVEILADEFAQRLRAGEQPTIDEYVSRYPEHAALIETLFPPIEMMERAGEQEQAEDTASVARFFLSRSTIGDFDIVREIGRGGMGVVYEAFQRSLGRWVALKVLGPAVAGSPAQRARFEREAEAAARLHHTNIVPVFGTGTEDGFHYYVMQFIDGVALSDVVYRLGRSANADACPEDVLHEQTHFTASDAAALLLEGTVRDRNTVRNSSAPSAVSTEQRSALEAGDVPDDSGEGPVDSLTDVPPGSEPPHAPTDSGPERSSTDLLDTLPSRSGFYLKNVARIGADLASALSYSHQHGVLHRDIKPSNILLDCDGIVWVADFGLAKHRDQADVTGTGDIVGTLRYMAPEQFRGDTDQRSDIYSLGLTLYELLTLQPAFDETRHGPLIEQKLAAAAPSPRRVMPNIPRDLDTIVVKACATEPAHRYQTASELAADLRRFLEDRPIQARPISSAERLWRWARRNPWIATLAASTAVLLLATAVVFAVGKYRTQQALDSLAQEKTRVDRALQQVEAEKERVEQENARAETNLRVAIEAFEQIAGNIASRGASQSLALVPGEEISAVTPADAELLEGMLTFFDQFAEHNRIDFAAESAASLKRVGDIHQQLGRLDDAEKAYRESLAIYERLIEQDDPATEHTLEAARIMSAMAAVHSRRGNMSPAIGAYHRARSLLDAGDTEAPAALRFELAKTLIQRRLISENAGEVGRSTVSRPGRGRAERRGRGRSRGGSALEDCDTAIDILDGLVTEAPAKAEYRLALAQAYRGHVRVLLTEERNEEAEASLQTAIACIEQLIADFPDATALRYELADALRTKTIANQDYEDRLRRAAAISGNIAAENPAILPYQALAGECLGQLGALELDAGRLDAAMSDYEQAVARLEPLADRLGGVLSAQLSYARTLADFAQVHVQRAQFSNAASLLDEAAKRLEAFEREHGSNRFTSRLLIRIRRCQTSLPIQAS